MPQDEAIETLSKVDKAYFGQRARNAWSNYILERFAKAESDGLTKAELARRIGKRPEQISRILSAPGNWTIETIQELLLGICAEEIVPNSRSIFDETIRNYSGPEWTEVSSRSIVVVKTSYRDDLVRRSDVVMTSSKFFKGELGAEHG
ncbi:helix-turn-helix domain-containing protein [Maricaulis alexandrii]|uniref:helix-turn-helix domain-containing protein n=1 Tax=Maricaulis alexandrii TaxID=2570354 RepID=UPI001108340C|nr:helix-turn-helix transcriptional regulator [Maricaulis alexandrii]